MLPCPYFTHSTHIQPWQLSGYTVFPHVNESLHTLMVTFVMCQWCPKWCTNWFHIILSPGGRGMYPPWNSSSSHNSVLKLSVSHLIDTLRSRVLLMVSSSCLSFLVDSGRCGTGDTLTVQVCRLSSPSNMIRDTSVVDILWYNSTVWCPSSHKVSPYFMRSDSPDHRWSHCSVEMSCYGGSWDRTDLPTTSFSLRRRIHRYLVTVT